MPDMLVLPEVSPVMLVFCVSSAVLVLPDMSPVMLALPAISPDVFVVRAGRRLRLRPRRLLPVLDVLSFCVVIIPPRVCSSLLFCVVEELVFCAETIRSAVTRETDEMSTNKTVMLRVMLLLLTNVSPFHVLLRTYL